MSDHVDQRISAHEERTRNDNVFLFLPNIIGYFRLALVLISWICHASSQAQLSLTCYIFAVVLDFFDGLAARRLQQSSAFGAWFDVFIDVVARTMMWNMIFTPSVGTSSTNTGSTSTQLLTTLSSSFPWGQLISSLEWLTFVCNHTGHGSRWKTRMTITEDSVSNSTTPLSTSVTTFSSSSPPFWVRRCFANGFKSPAGCFVIAGVHGLPPWLYGVTFVVVVGRTEGGALSASPWLVYELLATFSPVVLPVLICGRIFAAAVEMWIVWDHIRFLSSLKAPE